MTRKPPRGYSEIGESVAQLVAEEVRQIGWAFEIGKMLDFSASEVKAWVDHYKKANYQRLYRLKARRKKMDAKLESKRLLAEQALSRSSPTLDEGRQAI